jgi:hypothetical protein
LRGWIEFVGEDAHGNRDGDAFGIEIPEFAPVLPIETGARTPNIYVRYSDDGGNTWSAEAKVDDDTNHAYHFHNAISVAKTATWQTNKRVTTTQSDETKASSDFWQPVRRLPGKLGGFIGYIPVGLDRFPLDCDLRRHRRR